MSASKPLAVCVFCSSSGTIDRRHVDLAAEAGAELARRGHSLVSGGAQVSCMGAVARAARAGGARTVGVIPEGLVAVEISDEDNDELIVTPDMRARKGEMDRRSDAFLILPGGIGTLEELFEVWTARVLAMHEKPIVILDPTGVYDPLRELMRGLTEQHFARPKIWDAIGWTSSVPEAFDLLERSQPRIEFSPGDYAEAEL
ncbi:MULTISPECIES: TIGR00730 family Rossman fold protein [Actinomadura]|uniref:Cytokinin riboside 5'-monophosphate phosphoribohydrolase n=2 Tax=Actinomadura TaxID=1988 RepID=A0A5D0NQU5_9ACTN|nr:MULTISPECIES: TIGR00730 family Rossman fold protein [Actinomadura]TYB46662.1 TIGR00730 family Rossman fold protein [Actinomadura chibensis]TYK49173.1 TIGR00730 family Rossman fold protein [Actinomadura decatromicini]